MYDLVSLSKFLASVAAVIFSIATFVRACHPLFKKQPSVAEIQ
jgi:hypothetical protein